MKSKSYFMWIFFRISTFHDQNLILYNYTYPICIHIHTLYICIYTHILYCNIVIENSFLQQTLILCWLNANFLLASGIHLGARDTEKWDPVNDFHKYPVEGSKSLNRFTGQFDKGYSSVYTHQKKQEFAKCRRRNKRVCFIVAKDEKGWTPQKDNARKLSVCPILKSTDLEIRAMGSHWRILNRIATIRFAIQNCYLEVWRGCWGLKYKKKARDKKNSSLITAVF